MVLGLRFGHCRTNPSREALIHPGEMKNHRFWLLLLLVWPLMALGQEVGVVTLTDRPLKLIRGTSVFMVGEGARLRPGDIVECVERGLVQLELDGGTIIALHGDSRLFLYEFASGRRSRSNGPELVLLKGWLKAETKAGEDAYRLHTLLLTASTRDGTLVIHVTPESADVFLESGSGSVEESSGRHRPDRRVDGKPGQYFSLIAGKQIVSLPRPPTPFVTAVPISFQDTLPPRRQALRSKSTETKPDHDVTYPEIADWLKIDRRWRRGFIRQFSPRLRDPAFRRDLAANLKEHPEWHRILYPEKYRRKSAENAER